MISRKAYTEIFLSETNKSTDPANIEMHVYKWWFNRRTKKSGGLRLSDEGYEFLIKDLELHEHDIQFTDQIELSPNVIIFLENYLDCPYYLTRQSLTVFSEKVAFKLHMFSDDIRKLGLIKAMNLRKNDTEED